NSTASCTRNSASSGCSWCRTAAGCRSPVSSALTRRKISPRHLPRRSGKRSAARRVQSWTRTVLNYRQKSGGFARAPRLNGRQMKETPMLSPDRKQNAKQDAKRDAMSAMPNPMPLAAAAADYDVVRKAIGHIRGHWREQPEIEAIAEAAGVTPTELHHLFRRWAGITPKAFLQALTLDGARQLLRDSASVLDATYEVGLSGPGRLHDLFVTHEAMSPGEWKSGGEGLTVRYAFHPSPFGNALVMATERGLAGLAFADPGA